eukprot:403755_1
MTIFKNSCKHFIMLLVLQTLQLFNHALYNRCWGSRNIYVSKNGSDFPTCGNPISQSCGTIYYASVIFAETDYMRCIVIIDGQNKTQIESYYLNSSDIIYNPCVPRPIYGGFLKLQFNEDNIKSMQDWFPPICANNTISFKNKYLFESILNEYMYIYFYNLIVSDWLFDNTQFPFGIMRNIQQARCENCKFINITSVCSENDFNYVIQSVEWELGSTDGLHISESIFHNISYSQKNHSTCVSSHFIKGYGIVFYDNTVSNIYMEYSFLTTQSEMSIESSLFNGIHTQYTILLNYAEYKYDIPPITSYFYIYDTVFKNVTGSIYSSQDVSSYIRFKQITIFTSSINDEINNYMVTRMFYFGSNEHVTIESMNVYYNYKLETNCYFSDNVNMTAYNLSFDTIYLVECFNPQTIILNHGTINMNNISLNIDINNQSIVEYYGYISHLLNRSVDEFMLNFQYQKSGYASLMYGSYWGDCWNPLKVNVISGLIMNMGGEININNIVINPITFHDIMIYNFKGNINIDTATILYYDNYCTDCLNFEANSLHSTYFLYHSCGRNTISISNSDLYGVTEYLVHGTEIDLLLIVNSSFSFANGAIFAKFWSNVSIESSQFNKIGHFYADWYTFYNYTFISSLQLNEYGVHLWSGVYASIHHCNFDFYHQIGMLRIELPTYIVLKFNTFSRNTNDMKPEYSNHTLLTGSLIRIQFVDEYMDIISNNFSKQNIDTEMHWIHLYSTTGCLSGNVFYSAALFMEKNNDIASCYREDILNQCIDMAVASNNSVCCDDVYDHSDKNTQLVDSVAYFYLLDSNITYNSIFLDGHDNTLVLDNVKFISLNHIYNTQHFIFNTYDSNIVLLMDVVFITQNSDNINYNTNWTQCEVVCANQLVSSSNQQIIAELFVDCVDINQAQQIDFNNIQY